MTKVRIILERGGKRAEVLYEGEHPFDGTVTLSGDAEIADLIRAKVESGFYASCNEIFGGFAFLEHRHGVTVREEIIEGDGLDSIFDEVIAH